VALVAYHSGLGPVLAAASAAPVTPASALRRFPGSAGAPSHEPPEDACGAAGALAGG
jgi:hypothetical protein